MKTVTTVKVLSSCKSVLQFQFLGPRRQNLQSKKLKIDSYFEKRTISKNDRKVRLVVKKHANFKQNTYIQMKIQ